MKRILLIVFAALLLVGCGKQKDSSTDAAVEIAKAEAAKAEAEAAKAEAEAAKAQAEQAAASANAAAASANARAQSSASQTVTRAAVINDPDGWTNVRSGQSSNSSIVTKMWEGEVFYVDYTPGRKWVPVRQSQTGPRIGYIYAKLIRLI